MSTDPRPQRDWTTGPDGQSNSSDAFEEAVTAVARLLRNHMLGTDVTMTARLIVAQLAHRQRLAPRKSDV
jgi:hypothetical protein